METVGELSVGDQWSSFGGMFSSEEADFMVHLLDDSVPSEQCGGLNFETTSGNWPSMNTMGFDHNFYFCPESTNYCFPEGSSNSSVDSVVVHHTVDHQNYNLTNCSPMFVSDNGLTPMDYLMVDEPNMTFDILTENVMENTASLNKETSVGVMEESDAVAFDAIVLPEQKLQPKRKLEMAEPDISAETKKKAKKGRVSESVQRKRKNVQSKKKPRLDEIGNYHEKENTADLNTQSSSSCSFEDDTNVTNEHNDGLTLSPNGDKDLNSNVKTRASRGSATDPQSLYARKRRERINERLRMLQNLVPNGTKVDISTMLEEAVQYVKFLELQIKLLSSDDLWMYAPLAYNGMDIGLDLKISLP